MAGTRALVDHALKIANSENPDKSELAQLFDVRRAPGARVLVVPRGTPLALDQIPAETLAAVAATAGLRDMLRPFKERRYRELKNNPAYHGPIIVAEGDSWFEYFMSKDLLMWLGERYAVLSLAKAGDAWSDIYEQDELIRTVEIERPNIVMLSVGGNEVMGSMPSFVDQYDNSPNFDPAGYVNRAFADRLKYVRRMYKVTIQGVLDRGAQVILHGYDFPDPREWNSGGQWIGGPLERLGFGGVGMWRGIANVMVSRFNTMMEQLTAEFRKPDGSNPVHFVKLTGTIGTDDIVAGPDRALWVDEIHGTPDGFRDLAKRLSDKIDAISAVA